MNAITHSSDQSPQTRRDPFSARYGKPLPRSLREEAASMDWQTFASTYSRSSGPVRLGSWSTAAGEASGLRRYNATLGMDGSIRTVAATAPGAISAMTAMLSDAGFGLEILQFHQQQTSDGTATFVECEHEGRRRWAMGLAGSGEESSLRALVAGANRLQG
ncbi:2-isopropylmalate synthase [Rhodococcus sp. D2-41]|uniref:2-isopropylmalate synthase n=1 Tax=Speluncibacter jeojiensis TaxID=2710754 RepID=A0A9X4RFE2_9ACTN|nr:alpha-isopropylmalate synthase regulatory domain-containing protein [Rhodococcus sp. D2-41]MDG3011364.1 2-isopropylmalate synthase [Rhodococcus sp. D2-41]MDG3016624.1 2-isopropylmalate synthase [Corynebacteriales bacterium D3-21]